MIDAPIAIAFTAGMVATFNPCGFAMLPAYLGFFVGADRERASTLQALKVSAVVAGGFALVFGLAGVAILQLSLGIQRYVPWLTMIVGLALIPLGAWLLSGREVTLRIPRLQRGGRTRGLGSMFVFGVSYATVSLSCTLPAFLAVVATTFDRASFASGMAVFGAYAAGLAVVLGVLTTALALARDGFVRRIRGVLPYVSRASGALLVVAGAYLGYYGYFAWRIERGEDVAAGPVAWVSWISSWFSDLVVWTGTLRLGIAAIVALCALAVGAVLRRSRATSGR